MGSALYRDIEKWLNEVRGKNVQFLPITKEEVQHAELDRAKATAAEIDKMKVAQAQQSKVIEELQKKMKNLTNQDDNAILDQADEKSKNKDLKNQEADKAFKQKLTQLMKHEDGGFTFLIQRTQFNCLKFQFTATHHVLMEPKDIKKELIPLVKLLKKDLANLGIKPEQYKIDPNWEDFTLTITAEPSILNKIGEFLHTAGAKYFQSAPQAKAVLFGIELDSSPSSATAASVNNSQPAVNCILQ